MPDPSEVRITSSSGGSKGKKLAQYGSIPAAPLHAVAELYGKGAEKYSRDNWRRGYDWSLSFDALNRHLWLFWQGVHTDEETGLPHLAAVVFHAFALMEFVNTHPEFDDRPAHTPLSEAVAKTLDDDDREAGLSIPIIPGNPFRRTPPRIDPTPTRETRTYCRKPFSGFVCSEALGHSGEHVARGSNDREYARWPQ